MENTKIRLGFSLDPEDVILFDKVRDALRATCGNLSNVAVLRIALRTCLREKTGANAKESR